MTSEPDGQDSGLFPPCARKSKKYARLFLDRVLGRRWNYAGSCTATGSTGAQHMVIGRALFSSSDYRAP